MSLANLVIAITGSRRASEMARLVTSFGGKPYIAPTVGIEANPDISKEVQSFINTILADGTDYAIFMTGPGVYALLSTAKKMGMQKRLVEELNGVNVVARSSKPKRALADYGIKTDFVPDDNTAEGIVTLMKSHDMHGKRVLVLWHGSYSPTLNEKLITVGAHVFEFSTYSYSLELKESGARILSEMGFNYTPPEESKVVKLIEDINNGLIDVITFTSPPASKNLLEIAKKYRMKNELIRSLNEKVTVVAVGPPSTRALEEGGVTVNVMPNVYKMGPMLTALSSYLFKKGVSNIDRSRRVQGG